MQLPETVYNIAIEVINMGKELEFKLAAANDAVLDCLLGDPETAARMEGPIVCTPMETTYFDTETNAFRTNHWTLRRRQEGSRSVVCVKTPQPEPFARGEWEVEARAVDDARHRMAAGLRRAAAAAAALRRSALRPVCGARFLRRSVMLRLADGSRAELACDCGVLHGKTEELPFAEVELEIKEGAPDAAKALAGRLAKQYNLRWEPLSKFARANALK